MRKFVGAISAFVAVGCAGFTVMALHDFIVGDGHTEPGVLLGLTVFFGAMTFISGGAARRAFRAAPPETEPGADLEQRILRLAADNDGKVTVPEVALGCGVAMERAEAALDELAQRGRAEVQVTDAGETVYALKGFLSAAEKAAAKDPLA